MADAAPATPSPSRLARKLTTALAALLAAGVLLGPSAARAVDPFEIQVYDGTANSPGVPGIELHVNRVFDGIRTAEPPELPLHHQSHFTLEPSLGVSPCVAKSSSAAGYVAGATPIVPPRGITLVARAIACCAPAVTITSSARTPMRFAIQLRSFSSPSGQPYWSAPSFGSAITVASARCIGSRGKSAGSGNPPARAITSVRAAHARWRDSIDRTHPSQQDTSRACTRIVDCF